MAIFGFRKRYDSALRRCRSGEGRFHNVRKRAGICAGSVCQHDLIHALCEIT